MPKLIELRDRHQGQGLVLIGIHTQNGAENMAAFVKEQRIDYPVAVDSEAKTVAAFHVDSFPDYYVIDRAGRLRFADLANSELERAVTTLLGEPIAVEVAPTPWSAALADAAKRKKRVLVSTLDQAKLADLAGCLGKNRELARKLSDEYVRYDIASDQVGGHPNKMVETADLLIVVDEQGAEIARETWSGLGAETGVSLEKLARFLAKNAVEHPDAETCYGAALIIPKAENKRLFVHLGAPW